MGYGTYETTHKNIIESGQRLFMENGYERTNLRELCKEAGITTGSFYRHFTGKEDLFGYLVKPVIDSIHEMYHSSETLCFDYIKEDHIKELWQISNEAVTDIVKFIYQNFDSFKLLLQCADGTPYSSFLTDMTDMEVRSTRKMLVVMRERGIFVNDLSDCELHMLTHAYFSSIFECVMHDYTEEEALGYVHTVVGFFTAGWQKVLGL